MADNDPQLRNGASFQGRVIPFDREDVPTWFVHFESVLRIHGISGADRYDYLVASLTKPALAPIAAAIKRPPEQEEERYAWLKDQLITAHGRSNQERLHQLIAGEKIGDRRPSIFLSHLRAIAPRPHRRRGRPGNLVERASPPGARNPIDPPDDRPHITGPDRRHGVSGDDGLLPTTIVHHPANHVRAGGGNAPPQDAHTGSPNPHSRSQQPTISTSRPQPYPGPKSKQHPASRIGQGLLFLP